jgi:ribosome-associated protein
MKYSTPDDDEENLGPSKSALKREMTALQKLGAELVGLSKDQLKKIDMPDRLREAIHDAQRFNQNGAKRRQLQYIGKIMREIEPAPLQAAMDEIKGISAAASLRLQKIERLRTRFLADESVINNIVDTYPLADIQQLRQLRRNALKEAQQSKPPRAYRELFRVLRDLDKSGAGATDGADIDQAGETADD